MAQRLKTDWILFSTVVLMVLFGALMIYSASSRGGATCAWGRAIISRCGS